jgi:hypothetical protein
MNEIVKKNGITYGIISGVTSILITTLIYTFDINLFMSGWITFLKISVFTTIAIMLLVNTKKQLSNVFSFKTAFKTYFIHTIVGLLLATIFEIILFNIVDPSLKDSLKEMAMKFTAEFMEKLSVPASEINKALAEIEKTDQYSFFQLIKGLATYVLLASIFGLILAAIFKSKNTNQGF